MRGVRSTFALSLAALFLSASLPGATAPAGQTAPTARQFLSPASPLEVVAARKVDRIAWTSFQEGKRNAFTAAAPAFTPRRLTNFLKDDGIDLSDIQISDDGSYGRVPARNGAEPRRLGRESVGRPRRSRAIRVGRAHRGRRRVAGRGRRRRSRNWRPTAAPCCSCATARSIARKSRRCARRQRSIAARSRSSRSGASRAHRRGRPTAAASRSSALRTDHSFVVVYDVATRHGHATCRRAWTSTRARSGPPTAGASSSCAVPACRSVSRRSRGAAASAIRTDRRSSRMPPTGRGGAGPRWSWTRRPGCTSRGRRRGDAAAAQPPAPAPSSRVPGMMQAAFKGGYTLSVWKADVATGEAREVWHNAANDRVFTTLTNLRLAGDTLVFPLTVGGGGRGGRGRGGQLEGAPADGAGRAPPQGRWTSGTATTRST